MTFAEFLQQEMRRRDLSVRQFAEVIGIDHSTLSKLMRFEKPPTPSTETLIAVSKATGVSLTTLIALAFPDLKNIEVTANVLMLAERIERLPPDKRDLIDSLIMGMLLKEGSE